MTADVSPNRWTWLAGRPRPACSSPPRLSPSNRRPPRRHRRRGPSASRKMTAPRSCPGRAAADPDRSRQVPARQAQAPRGLQDRGLCHRHPQRALDARRRQGHAVRRSRLAGNVYAIVEKDGKREVKTIATGLHRPNGLAFHKGALYVAELSKVWRYDNIEDNLDKPPASRSIDLRRSSRRTSRTAGSSSASGPTTSSTCRSARPATSACRRTTHAQIRRMNLDGNGVEVVARGVRNTVGFDWHPETKELYFTDNGRDWVSEDLRTTSSIASRKAGSALRLSVLPPGRLPRSGIRLGQVCDELRQAGRAARPAHGRARHALLHRQHVPGAVPERDLHRAARLLEPHQEDRRRRRGGDAQRGRHRQVGRAVPHRLHPEQQLYRPAG